MPEEEDPVRAAEEAGAVDDVGPAVEDGLEERRVLGGVVLQVGVLDEDDVARRRGESRLEGRPLAHVPRLEEDPDVRGLRGGRRRSRVPSVEKSSTTTISFSSRQGDRPDAPDDLDDRYLSRCRPG